jgi:hypothetical protein
VAVRSPLVVGALQVRAGWVIVESEALQYLGQARLPFHCETIRCAMLALVVVPSAMHVARQHLDRRPAFEIPPGIVGLRCMVCASYFTIYGPVQAGWGYRAH